ncbi:MAG: hypothetical protein IKQ35_03965 [Bacilli bacterium]|nr:hypothetical protein [Bacilli bacterium]
MAIANLLFYNLQLVSSGKNYGPMSYSPEFYPEGKPENERRAEFMCKRMNLGSEYGFCGRNMFVSNYIPTTGSYHEITSSDVEENYTGFPDANISSDILVVTSATPDVVIGGLHKGMPVVLAYDMKQNILASINCPPIIDREVPNMLIDALNSFGSKEEDIYVYIGPSIEDISFDDAPVWLGKDRDSFIEFDSRDRFHVNPKDVLVKDFRDRGVRFIEKSRINTLYDYDYYYGDEAGYNFTGGFIMSKDNCKRLKMER